MEDYKALNPAKALGQMLTILAITCLFPFHYHGQIESDVAIPEWPAVRFQSALMRLKLPILLGIKFCKPAANTPAPLPKRYSVPIRFC